MGGRICVYAARIARPARIAALTLGVVACAPAPAATHAPVAPLPPAASASAPPAPTAKTFAKTSTEKVASLDDHAWPPPRPDDEDWVAFDRPWLHKLKGAPPTFYTTSVRPDPARKARVHVVALDARQIELDMAIGAEGPYPPDEKTNGKWPRGGKLPRDATATKVVAAFNGAFRLDQSAWGMTIRRRTFAPPLKDVASLLMHDDGRLGFGTWGPDMQTPPDVRSLRQNLDPLLDGGVVNPRGRPRWGGIIKTASTFGQRAKRSGMCRTAGGHFLYFYGDAIEAVDLGNAMKQVGCDYGMHLDMNAIHVGFVFMSFEDEQYKVGNSETLTSGMGITNKKYVHQPNPKEFFYATLRTPLVGPDPSFVPDGHAQPPPAWLPAILARAAGDTRATFVDARRVRFVVTAAGAELPLDERDRVLAAIEVSDVGLKGNALELGGAHPLIANGKALDTPAELSLALGVTAPGDVLIAEGKSPSAIREALLQAGCVRAVEARSFERAGRDAIAAGGTGPRLYVLAEKPVPATYRFDLDEHGALRWPRVTKPLK